MNNRSIFRSALAGSVMTLLTIRTAYAQTSSRNIVGQWRADTPLPNGVVQTFSFDADGTFDLSQALAVDGTYRVDGDKLIETVTLPSTGTTHTDTARFAIAGDSLVVSEHESAQGSASPRVLRRSGATSPTTSIVGDWSIPVSTGAVAHYVFEVDGTMRVRANVGDERGKYVISADTLHLSNEQTFQLPATARFAIVSDVLTLTPPSGKQPRQFHKVAPH
jgi:hypothetical protein